MHKLITNRRHELEMGRRIRNIQAFGDQCMSYSATQDCIKEFRHASFKGFIAYATVWGKDYVLSDPITPKQDYLKASMLFLDKHKDAVFCQISHRYATQLSLLNFKINGFGVENIVNLKDFKVTWKKRKCLKSYLSKLGKQGFHVFEYKPQMENIQAISDQWLQEKANSKELRFMARPFVHIDETDVRYFYLIHNRTVIGFCSFDPIYSSDNTGRITSYALQHLRVSNAAPLGSQDFLILNALSQFKDEGFKKISLGLAPLYKRDKSLFNHSRLAESIFSLVYKMNAFYNYRTIGEHKDHYKAQQIQTYVASPKKFTIRQLCGLLKINNLI